MTRYNVVQREVADLLTAVLARVRVAREYLTSCELHPWSRPADLVLKADHGGRAVVDPRRPDHLVVVLNDLSLLAEDQPEGPWQVADVERLVALIENQDHTVHRRIVDRKRSSSAARGRTSLR